MCVYMYTYICVYIYNARDHYFFIHYRPYLQSVPSQTAALTAFSQQHQPVTAVNRLTINPAWFLAPNDFDTEASHLMSAPLHLTRSRAVAAWLLALFT